MQCHGKYSEVSRNTSFHQWSFMSTNNHISQVTDFTNSLLPKGKVPLHSCFHLHGLVTSLHYPLYQLGHKNKGGWGEEEWTLFCYFNKHQEVRQVPEPVQQCWAKEGSDIALSVLLTFLTQMEEKGLQTPERQTGHLGRVQECWQHAGKQWGRLRPTWN